MQSLAKKQAMTVCGKINTLSDTVWIGTMTSFHIFPFAAVCAAAAVQPVYAASLQSVVHTALQNDPAMLEARANIEAAATDVKIAQAGHYPVVTLTGTQTLAQRHRYEGNRRSGFNPGVQASLNLYSWGGVEARVRQNRHKETYQRYKADETGEDVGRDAGTLYLSALRAKELIETAQNNLKRHENIIKDLEIITRYDKGRMSELHQAQARSLRVEAYIAEQMRTLELSLSRLGKYTGTRIAPQQLYNPFDKDTPDSLIKTYRQQDLGKLPSFRAQAAERESVLAEGDVRKSARYPSINLIASATRDNKEVYVNLSWDAYNPAAYYEVQKNAQTLVAAEAKMDQILRDTTERARSSEVDMRQSLKRESIAERQISAQKKVVKAYELQFKIARRTLIDVLDAYSDLSNIELTAVSAQNDFRDAAWDYLSSQGAVTRWANGQ